MSLNANVYPGVLTTIDTVIGPGLFAAAGVGIPGSVPQTPYVAIGLGSFDAPSEAGSDLMETMWTIELTILVENTDASNAELRLSELVGPLRAVFNAHVKMGQPTVARARIIGGDAGYMLVNGIEYRSLVARLSVVEKESVTYGA